MSLAKPTKQVANTYGVLVLIRLFCFSYPSHVAKMMITMMTMTITTTMSSTKLLWSGLRSRKILISSTSKSLKLWKGVGNCHQSVEKGLSSVLEVPVCETSANMFKPTNISKIESWFFTLGMQSCRQL